MGTSWGPGGEADRGHRMAVRACARWAVGRLRLSRRGCSAGPATGGGATTGTRRCDRWWSRSTAGVFGTGIDLALTMS